MLHRPVSLVRGRACSSSGWRPYGKPQPTRQPSSWLPAMPHPRAKARADLVCDGQNDEVELLQSVQFARRYVVRHATAPSGHREVSLPGRHTVEWLPGT
ncbi:MAG: hypothetical protein VX346_05890 [Planctomycetota bacterium]|nr:hypothetical protein [Planctomycetota bacterium]